MNNLDYGIIGNCRSAAIISKKGSIDWCCLPEFDASSVFAKILDEKIGGSFEIETAPDYVVSQQYLEETAILITSFVSEENTFEVHDYFPRYYKSKGISHTPPQLVRYFKLIKGTPQFKVNYNPKLEYALGETRHIIKKDKIVSITESPQYDTLFLYTSFSKESVVNQELITLKEDGYFLLNYYEKIEVPTLASIAKEKELTLAYWKDWTKRTTKYKLFNKEINRSAITLKLLSYDKTGAVLAAATTSLPETIGEVRNWDYRFCWIRDGSMVIKVVSELGHKNMAKRYLQFIIDLIPDKDDQFQIMYGINKEKQLTEKTLDHLSGYKNSAPVRIGNAAYEQTQNDIYGILMDVLYVQFNQFNKDIEPIEELWGITKGIVWLVAKNWKNADKGIWEFREEDRHFTFSKVMCWVAVDRAIKIATQLGKSTKVNRWEKLAKEIKEDIHEFAWDNTINSFTQSYGLPFLDASVLLMESYGFIEAKDPKYVSTVKAIEKELNNDGLMYRYKNKDDFGLPSSSFTICTFWFINSLFKIGEKEKALAHFKKLLGYSNHLGLFSEDIDFKTKRLLGNFPQAYSHLALIECAINFSKDLDD